MTRAVARSHKDTLQEEQARLEAQLQTLKDKLAANKAQQAAEDQRAWTRRAGQVGKLAMQAGLGGWTDTTLAEIFTLVAGLPEAEALAMLGHQWDQDRRQGPAQGWGR